MSLMPSSLHPMTAKKEKPLLLFGESKDRMLLLLFPQSIHSPEGNHSIYHVYRGKRTAYYRVTDQTVTCD